MDSCWDRIMSTIASFMSSPLSLFPIFSSFLCNRTIAFSNGDWSFLWFLATILISGRQNIVGIIRAIILFMGFCFVEKSRIYFVWWSHKFVSSLCWNVFHSLPLRLLLSHTLLYLSKSARHFSFNFAHSFLNSTPMSKHILWNCFKISSHLFFLPWLLFVVYRSTPDKRKFKLSVSLRSTTSYCACCDRYFGSRIHLELDWRCPCLVQTEGDRQHRGQVSGKSGRDLASLDNAEEADFEPCQHHAGDYRCC